VQFDRVAVGVLDPGLPTVVAGQQNAADLDALGLEVGDGFVEIVHFEAQVAVGLPLGPRTDLALEDLDERAAADVNIYTGAFALVVAEIKRGREAEFVAVKRDGAPGRN
jgi:hypothetical protein